MFKRTRRLVLALTISVLATSVPSVASAPRFEKCKSVRVQLGIEVASVSQRNTSCRFAREFVRSNDNNGLCASSVSKIKGWRVRHTGRGEGDIATLRKGSKTIRTNACST